MSYSVTSVIVDALRYVGKIPIGQSVPSEVTALGLNVMNDVLAEWGASRIFIPYQSELDLPLVYNKEVYTVGPSPSYDLNTAQIIEILELNILDPASPGVFYGTEAFNEQQYFNLSYRASTAYPCVWLLRNHDDYSEIRFQPLPYKVLTAQMLVKQRLSSVMQGQTLSEIPAHYLLALKLQIGLYMAYIIGYQVTPDYVASTKERVSKLLAANFSVDYSVRRDEFLNRYSTMFFYYFNQV